MKPLASSLLTCGALLLASTALAQDGGAFPVGECGQLSYAPSGDALSYCELENPGHIPIARVKAKVSLQHPAHEAPFASHIVEFTVPGGVPERGTNSVPFPHEHGADLPSSPMFRTVVEVMEAWDYDGRQISPARAVASHEAPEPVAPPEATTPKPARKTVDLQLPTPKTAEVARHPVTSESRTPVRKTASVNALQEAKPVEKPKAARWAKMSSDDRRVLAEEVRACWTVNARSDIADIELIVEFDLDEDGQLIGDVETIRASDANERVVWDAYMAARRAILRCQGNGFPVAAPAEKIRMIFAGGNTVEVL